MKPVVLDIEVHDQRNGWAQAKYLVHCFHDVLWTNSIDEALEALRYDLENLSEYEDKEELKPPKWPEGPEIIDEADVKPRFTKSKKLKEWWENKKKLETKPPMPPPPPPKRSIKEGVEITTKKTTRQDSKKKEKKCHT